MHALRSGILTSLLAAEYVVYSYATPIAWFHCGVWHGNTEGYSQTTTRQLNGLRREIVGDVVEH